MSLPLGRTLTAMDKTMIDQELSQIKAVLATVMKQDCEDIDSFDFIKINTSVLKARIHALKERIGLELDNDKEFKMAYQKLYNTLQHIQTSLKFKMPLNPAISDIRHQISLIKAVQKDIENL